MPYADGAPFWAIGEVVKARVGIPESDPAPFAAADEPGQRATPGSAVARYSDGRQS